MMNNKSACEHNRHQIVLGDTAVCGRCGAIVHSGRCQIFDEGRSVSPIQRLLDELSSDIDDAAESCNTASCDKSTRMYHYHRGRQAALIQARERVQRAFSEQFAAITKPNMN